MSQTTIFIGSDYRGFDKKKLLKDYLTSCHPNYELIDSGTNSKQEDDYNDSATKVSKSVLETPNSFGILICDSSHGMTIQANRFKGIRAVSCTTSESAKLAREHDDANILCLSAALNSTEELKSIIDAFLATNFTPLERRLRRISKLDKEI